MCPSKGSDHKGSDHLEGWSDATLHGFWWHENGQDFVLNMEFLSNIGRKNIRFTWAHALKIDLKFADHELGEPMLWKASMDRQTENSHFICLDFASKGRIEFYCQSLLWD